MKTMRSKATAALVLALALVPARAVRADDPGQRDALVREINGLLGEMRSTLDAVPGSSSSINDERAQRAQTRAKPAARFRLRA